METDRKKSFLINSIYIIFIVASIFIVFKYLLWFLFPFLIAVIVGFAVQKPAMKISKKFNVKTESIAAVLAVLVYVVLGALISVLFFYIFKNLPPLVRTFSEWLTIAAERLTLFFNKYIDYTKNLPEEIGLMLKNLPNALANSMVSFLSGFVSNTVSIFAKNIPSVFFTFIITILASAYFSHDFKIVKKFIFSIIGEEQHKNLKKIKNIMFTNVLKMLKGYAVLCFITFIELSVGFLILGVKNPFLLAGIIALIDALPVFGVGIVLLPWAIISFLSGAIGFGIFLTVLYLITTIIRNILEPKILSGNLGIPPLLSLIIIFCGLKLFGFLGMLGLFVTLVIIIDFYREESR